LKLESEAGPERNAQWDGWQLVRYAPDGGIDRIVELPVQKPTSCMSGGEDLSILHITSAVWDLTGEALGAQPQAGGLFALNAGVKGLPEPRFAGSAPGPQPRWASAGPASRRLSSPISS
jgi:hypothetical protein